MNEFQVDGSILSFDEDKREVEVLLMPWDAEAEQKDGIHRFERGAFKDVDPTMFRSRMRHQDPPTGRGFKLEEQEDGPHLWFRVSKTGPGDEQLTLIKDKVEDGISIGFDTSDHKTEKLPNGRNRYTHTGFSKARRLEVSTTWAPAFKDSRVLSFMEDNVADKDEAQAEAPEAPVPAATDEALQAFQDNILSKFEALQDRITAQGLQVPDAVKQEEERLIAFGRDLIAADATHQFDAADVTSADHTGVLPIDITGPTIGVIDASRPFMESTTRIPAPRGETLRVPKITQRPTVAKQSAEKAELSSQKSIIGYVDFDMDTYGGYGDLSIQLIKRSSPDFLNQWVQLLGEAYAISTDDAAVDALLAETAVVEGTGTFDPSSPSFGESFQNAATAAGSRPALLPNRIWLSTAALVAFIDAKSPTGGGGTPLYPGLAGIAGVQGDGNGAGPAGFRMQPIWVPALDDESVDLIIGPAAGFRWAEDGTYTLTADVPGKAGRDVGLVGMVWFGPVYPAAFTTYTLAS